MTEIRLYEVLVVIFTWSKIYTQGILDKSLPRSRFGHPRVNTDPQDSFVKLTAKSKCFSTKSDMSSFKNCRRRYFNWNNRKKHYGLMLFRSRQLRVFSSCQYTVQLYFSDYCKVSHWKLWEILRQWKRVFISDKYWQNVTFTAI